MNILDGLNNQQREAVTTVEGPLLIVAGAGSGKTRVITFRIAYLIKERGVRPENILAVTFTNKAADEMKTRVESLLEGEHLTAAPLISTFHSLCVRILRREIDKLDDGYTRNFTIYDTDDQIRLIRSCMRDLDLDEKILAARSIQAAISWAKNRSLSAESYMEQARYARDPKKDAIARVFKLYQQSLHSNNALDFDDLLIKTVELLRKSAETRAYYHNKFRHVMIDEFQDTNGIQYELSRLIVENCLKLERSQISAGELWRDRSLCVVGDTDQAIYSFRGSDFHILLNFQNDFRDTKTIKLEQNYRSTERILELANRIIERNRQRLPKNLVAFDHNGEGEKISYYQAYDGEGEARFVAERIGAHLRQDPNIRCCVLYRANAQSRLFEEACRREGLRYNIVGGFSFYERAEIKDIIAYLKLALNPHDSISLARIINTPARGIGKSTMDEIERQARANRVSLWQAVNLIIEKEELAPRAINALRAFREVITSLAENAATAPLSQVVKAAMKDTGYIRALQEEDTAEAEGRLLNLEELVNAAVEAEEQHESLRDFLDHASLVADIDQYQPNSPVTLMTMHSAKGLEFPVVFIVGLEEGLFPHARSLADEAGLEEERRLCYVAVTRAEKHLYITHSLRRRIYGEETATTPSRFLNEMPPELLEDLSSMPSWLSNRYDSSQRETAQFGSKRTSNYTGPTYNSVESIRAFFKEKSKYAGGEERTSSSRSSNDKVFKPGTRVRHPKYGMGIVLRREGEGDSAKLLVSFPGFGQKKLIEKYAGLEEIK